MNVIQLLIISELVKTSYNEAIRFQLLHQPNTLLSLTPPFPPFVLPTPSILKLLSAPHNISYAILKLAFHKLATNIRTILLLTSTISSGVRTTHAPIFLATLIA